MQQNFEAATDLEVNILGAFTNIGNLVQQFFTFFMIKDPNEF